MIENAQVTPVLPVADLTRATGFYRDRLGLKDLGEEVDGGRNLQTGSGSTIGLMQAEPGAQTAHTVLTFEIDNIEDEIKQLKGRGVSFLDYDTPQIKTVNHVAEFGGDKAAWFQDSEGNFLCLHQRRNG